MLAAPNQSSVTGKVVEFSWTGLAEDKIHLVVKVDSFSSLSGPCLLEKDQLIKCFYYAEHCDYKKGDQVSLVVEYIGGPVKGVYQVLSVYV